MHTKMLESCRNDKLSQRKATEMELAMEMELKMETSQAANTSRKKSARKELIIINCDGDGLMMIVIGVVVVVAVFIVVVVFVVVVASPEAEAAVAWLSESLSLARTQIHLQRYKDALAPLRWHVKWQAERDGIYE